MPFTIVGSGVSKRRRLYIELENLGAKVDSFVLECFKILGKLAIGNLNSSNRFFPPDDVDVLRKYLRLAAKFAQETPFCLINWWSANCDTYNWRNDYFSLFFHSLNDNFYNWQMCLILVRLFRAVMCYTSLFQMMASALLTLRHPALQVQDGLFF